MPASIPLRPKRNRFALSLPSPLENTRPHSRTLSSGEHAAIREGSTSRFRGCGSRNAAYASPNEEFYDLPPDFRKLFSEGLQPLGIMPSQIAALENCRMESSSFPNGLEHRACTCQARPRLCDANDSIPRKGLDRSDLKGFIGTSSPSYSNG